MTGHSHSLLAHLHRLAAPAAPDAVLLTRWIEHGEETAFATLMARHGPMVLGVCRRILGDVQDAEDAFQATFLVLARKAAKLRLSLLNMPFWQIYDYSRSQISIFLVEIFRENDIENRLHQYCESESVS